MFTNFISSPIDPITKEYVDTLVHQDCEPDYSLICLSIALLKSRIDDFKGIGGTCESRSMLQSCIERFMYALSHRKRDVPNFFYLIYEDDDDKIDTCKTVLKNEGFEIKEPIGQLLKARAGVDCIAAFNKTINACAIFINNSSIKYYHFLLSFLSVLFPAYFVDKPLTPEEYELIKSLSKADSKVFVDRIRDCVSVYNTEFKKRLVTSFLQSVFRRRISEAEMVLNEKKQDMANAEMAFSSAIASFRKATAEFEGMKITQGFGEEEQNLTEYLAENKSIYGLKTNNMTISFAVTTLLNNFDENAWETFSKAGHIYDGEYGNVLLEAFRERANRVTLLNSIFSADAKFSVKMKSNYILDLENTRVLSSSGYSYETIDPVFDSYLDNPHIKLYACLGGYKSRVMVELTRKNYIGAIELCIASAGSVNLDETTQTFRPFLGWILSSRKKILKRYDGVDMTPEEALVWLSEQEGKENEEN